MLHRRLSEEEEEEEKIRRTLASVQKSEECASREIKADLIHISRCVVCWRTDFDLHLVNQVRRQANKGVDEA